MIDPTILHDVCAELRKRCRESISEVHYAFADPKPIEVDIGELLQILDIVQPPPNIDEAYLDSYTHSWVYRRVPPDVRCEGTYTGGDCRYFNVFDNMNWCWVCRARFVLGEGSIMEGAVTSRHLLREERLRGLEA